MSIGDSNDVFGRLKAALPQRWFGSTSDSMPVVDSILAGLGTGLTFIYSLYAYAKAQTRLLTCSDGFLDIFASDFFGSSIQRKANQSDASFRGVIQANLFAEKATRKGVVNVLTTITGRAPVVFEPNRVGDVAIMGVPTAGGQNYMGIQTSMYVGPARMASTATPYQAFIIAYRPQATGGSAGGAFTDAPTQAALNTPLAKSYTNSLSLLTSSATDADIYAAVDATRPVGTILWVSISN
ncbi:hypothetical protein BZM27_06100 [Paraburkholderia steynii]|uniref:Uncharacterized protein n=1 Tax=Paraburkholderia steynii TaxID=1245441 RepID=A0A4R0XPL9_9BURK|nr:hypothetical protein BZM27_06100 [Paraburkholderia steynii]